jgi:ABC-2 type transport system permease protein
MVNVLRQIAALTRKELAIWFKRPGQWLVVFVVPFFFIWIISAVFGGSQDSPRVALYLVDEDHSQASAQLVNALQTSVHLEVEMLSERAEADQRVSAGQRMAALVVPPGFGQAMLSPQGGQLELIVDPARQEQAAIVDGLVGQALASLRIDAEVSRQVNQRVDQALAALGPGAFAGADLPALNRVLRAAAKGVITAQVQQALERPLVQVALQAAGGETAAHPPSLVESLAPGYSLMFVFFLVQMLAASVIEERDTGALRRLLAMPAHRVTLLAGKALPYVPRYR